MKFETFGLNVAKERIVNNEKNYQRYLQEIKKMVDA